MTNRKKIVYVEANEDGTIGGSHYCLLEIVKNLDRTKFEPVVCFYQANDLVDIFKQYTDVYFIKNPRGVSFRMKYPQLFSIAEKYRICKLLLLSVQKLYNLIRYEFSFYLEIIFFVIRYKIDVIHLNNAPILPQWLLASKLTGKPIVSHVRGNLILPRFLQMLVPMHDRIISISDAVTDFASKHGIDTSNFNTIYDGIDVKAVRSSKKSDPETIRKKFGMNEDQVVIGLVGNIKDWKGQHVLVDAVNLLINKYPDIICLIIGAVSDLAEDQSYFRLIKKKIADNHLENNVLITGYRDDIPDIISVLDVVVHTSTAPEPLGRVVLEGMLFAKPVIATAHGGPVEIIENNISGVLVPPGNCELLAEAIDKILSDDKFRKSLCENSVKRVNSKFSIENNVQQIEKLYEKL